jgi:hypothetical protein
MAFACPECCDPASLRITSSIELPPDSRSDEITLQIVECARCGFRAAAVYEESRRGSLDSEAGDHFGYRVASEILESLVTQINACPGPGNRGCPCESHRRLGTTDDSGRWRGFVDTADAFPMRYTKD